MQIRKQRTKENKNRTKSITTGLVLNKLRAEIQLTISILLNIYTLARKHVHTLYT